MSSGSFLDGCSSSCSAAGSLAASIRADGSWSTVQYTNNGVLAANLDYIQQPGAAHTFPTDFDSTGNNT